MRKREEIYDLIISLKKSDLAPLKKLVKDDPSRNMYPHSHPQHILNKLLWNK